MFFFIVSLLGWGWGLGGGPDVPHAANLQQQHAAGLTPPEGQFNRPGGVGDHHLNKQNSELSDEQQQEQQSVCHVNCGRAKTKSDSTFH